MTCPSNKLSLQVENDNPIYWEGVQDQDGEYRDDAVVVADLYLGEFDRDDPLPTNTVNGATGIDLDYITDSFGRYRGVIPSTVDLQAGTEYTLVLTAVVDGDNETQIIVPCVAMDRTE